MTASLLDDLLEFAAIPAPTFSEQRRLDWLEQRLADADGRLARDEVGNLIWSFGEGPPAVLLLAHVDTVFPFDVALAFERSGGRLTGPGIGDNAAAVVAVVHAVEVVLTRGVAKAGAVAFTVGEEGLGNLRGAHGACEQLRPTCAIAVEGHGLDQVLVDAVGSVRLRMQVTGPGGHSWEDRGAPSAVHAVLEIGRELTARGAPDAPVNIGLVSGGQSINTIAASAELLVELRAVDEHGLEDFAAAARAMTVEPPLALSVDEVGRRPAGRLDRSDPLLATVGRIRSSLGLPDRLSAGSTDANAALARGIPALTLGVAQGGLMHTTSEWIEEASLELGVQQVEDVLTALLGAA